MRNNYSSEINDRAQKILHLLIECYIRDGQPVGSKTLAQTTALSISPASIRNIMSDLEMAGFLHSPHTSAGRVPTVKGYRFFVDSLLNVQANNGGLLQENWGEQLRCCTDTKELVKTASTMLSSMTKLASIIMLPRITSTVLRHIEFLPLTDNRVLVILVLHKHEVQNRIIYADRCYTYAELQMISNYLTANFAGKELHEIKQLLVIALQQSQTEITNLTQAMIDMASQALGVGNSSNDNSASSVNTDGGNDGIGENSSAVTSENSFNVFAADYVLSGEAHLLDMPEQVAAVKLRDLFTAFAEKRDILYLLNQCLNTDGIKIYIGEESGYAPLGDCSLITTPYREGQNGKIIGVLGVIGPTRMPYDRALAAVDVTSRLLSAALEEME